MGFLKQKFFGFDIILFGFDPGGGGALNTCTYGEVSPLFFG